MLTELVHDGVSVGFFSTKEGATLEGKRLIKKFKLGLTDQNVSGINIQYVPLTEDCGTEIRLIDTESIKNLKERGHVVPRYRNSILKLTTSKKYFILYGRELIKVKCTQDYPTNIKII
jgi:hypothetical protein